MSQEEVLALVKASPDRGFMWKASKAGHVSFLYGTVHVAEPKKSLPGPQVIGAMQATDTMAVELDVDTVAADMQTAIKHQAPAPVSGELKERIERLAVANCIDPARLQPMSPQFQLMGISMVDARRAGLYAEYSIDSVLQGMAKGMKRPIRPLETAELQASVLAGSDSTQAATQMVEALEHGESAPLMRKLFDAWERGDDATFKQFFDEQNKSSDPGAQALYRRMFTERNESMAKHIEELHQTQRLFVAVGAGHMVGDDGLPALLSKRGFSVERVPLNAAAAH